MYPAATAVTIHFRSRADLKTPPSRLPNPPARCDNL